MGALARWDWSGVVCFAFGIGSLISVLVDFFFFSSRRRHTRSLRDWSSDVCSSDLRSRTMEAHAGFRSRQQRRPGAACPDRKSTRLNSSHVEISYAVFCLKKKKKQNRTIINYTTNTTKYLMYFLISILCDKIYDPIV